MKTFIPKIEESDKKWYLIDLKGATLGRAAVEAANILRGKNKPIFTPHLDTGDYLVVINAAQVSVTGNKTKNKLYYHYSGYPGGLKVTPYDKLLKSNARDIFTHAVTGMLPKNRLGRKMIKKLHVYADEKHPHQAQKPEVWKLSES
ncbi:MAG: 50S ribosomal protein L13 [candidate division Zixibacteria bacterium]|jgi:large subunit ribosomal protein L13|nr:50S ribosomal protein L13 [candidate division Zixibacteria bacterium]